ncbi:MAG: hypothetical protein ACI9MC_001215 [Kiritimatiellia bacterium]|jgi:uncharacterized protein (DUF58 family)
MSRSRHKPRPLWRTLPIVIFQGIGVFLLPFLLGLVAAMFMEVSEVAETLPALQSITIYLLTPIVLAQLAGLVLKSRRELRWWRSQGKVGVSRLFDVLARHAQVVTMRGWTVLFGGVFLTLFALYWQWASFGLLAVLGLLLFYVISGWTVFVSTFMIRSFERGLSNSDSAIQRRMTPAVVETGDAVEERFTFRRVKVPMGFRLLVEDPLPPRLRTESRYSVGSSARSGEVHCTGQLRATPRGYFRLGPAQLWYQDLLGITRVSIASHAIASLKVLPRVRPVEVLKPPRSPSSKPDVLTKPHRFPTEDLFRFREYAHGDDTRRIHWRLSLKHGHLQMRVPETRETSTQDVLLVLDTYVPTSLLRSAGQGADDVLDKLVDAWIGLAVELVQRGDRVRLVASVQQHDDHTMAIERVSCRKGETARWQDLGARVAWQSEHPLLDLLADCGDNVHGLIATARFMGPPPGSFPGADTTWLFLDPSDALGEQPRHWLAELTGGTPLTVILWLLRLPETVGSEDNALTRRVRSTWELRSTWRARRHLRRTATASGRATLAALCARGDAVYSIQPGDRRVTFRGVQGRGGAA